MGYPKVSSLAVRICLSRQSESWRLASAQAQHICIGLHARSARPPHIFRARSMILIRTHRRHPRQCRFGLRWRSSYLPNRRWQRCSTPCSLVSRLRRRRMNGLSKLGCSPSVYPSGYRACKICGLHRVAAAGDRGQEKHNHLTPRGLSNGNADVAADRADWTAARAARCSADQRTFGHDFPRRGCRPRPSVLLRRSNLPTGTRMMQVRSGSDVNGLGV